jgi:hypothetical protein
LICDTLAINCLLSSSNAKACEPLYSNTQDFKLNYAPSFAKVVNINDIDCIKVLRVDLDLRTKEPKLDIHGNLIFNNDPKIIRISGFASLAELKLNSNDFISISSNEIKCFLHYMPMLVNYMKVILINNQVYITRQRNNLSIDYYSMDMVNIYRQKNNKTNLYTFSHYANMLISLGYALPAISRLKEFDPQKSIVSSYREEDDDLRSFVDAKSSKMGIWRFVNTEPHASPELLVPLKGMYRKLHNIETKNVPLIGFIVECRNEAEKDDVISKSKSLDIKIDNILYDMKENEMNNDNFSDNVSKMLLNANIVKFNKLILAFMNIK